MRGIKPGILEASSPASLVMVGEITEVLRAQGNPSATGLEINTSDDSPVISGIYEKIPQLQIGLMDSNSFLGLAGEFKTGGGVDSPFDLVGAASLDAIFCPYNNAINPEFVGDSLPYWKAPTDESTFQANSRTLNPFNPFKQLDAMSPYGNPINNDPWMSGGHNIGIALSFNPENSGEDGLGGYVGLVSGVYPSGSGGPVDLHFEKDHWARHTVEAYGIRGVGLKSPMVLTGWGFDVNDLPVPRETESSSTFHPQASWNVHLWKSGPVDLRWDDERGVWTGGNTTKIYLVKLTNLYTPTSFSFEVDRSNSRDQYTRNAPGAVRNYNATENLYDPEYVAYQNNSDNQNYYEQLDYNGLEYPYYEAFIIRETQNSPSSSDYYNIWTEDCQDCGHITNDCGGGHDTVSSGKKILIENPLRQSFDVGDLAFTVYTGRRKKVNSGGFTGGTGSGASGRIQTDSEGNASFSVIAPGAGYTKGGFGVVGTGCNICTDIVLNFSDGELSGATLTPSGGFLPSQTCDVNIYPNDTTVETELLPIHWVMQAEFKSQQVVTHVACDNGLLQSCTMKLQTQGYKTCEWCGEDTAFINN